MKRILITTVAVLALIGQVNAQELLSKSEFTENAAVVLGMAQRVKALASSERDGWVTVGASVVVYNQQCTELPVKVRLAAAGIMMGLPQPTVDRIEAIEKETKVTGIVEFCGVLKSAMEKLVRDFH
jgi:hypothetical protein